MVVRYNQTMWIVERPEEREGQEIKPNNISFDSQPTDLFTQSEIVNTNNVSIDKELTDTPSM